MNGEKLFYRDRQPTFARWRHRWRFGREGIGTLQLAGTTIMEISRNSGVLTSDEVVGLTQVNYGDTFPLFVAGLMSAAQPDDLPAFFVPQKLARAVTPILV